MTGFILGLVFAGAALICLMNGGIRGFMAAHARVLTVLGVVIAIAALGTPFAMIFAVPDPVADWVTDVSALCALLGIAMVFLPRAARRYPAQIAELAAIQKAERPQGYSGLAEAAATWREVARTPIPFLRASGVAVGVCAAVAGASFLLVLAVRGSQMAAALGFLLGIIAFSAALLTMLSAMAISLHRWVQVGEAPTWRLPLNRNVMAYALRLLLIFTVLGGVERSLLGTFGADTGAPSWIGEGVTWLVWTAGAYFIGSVGLIFPVIAEGGRLSIGAAMTAGRNLPYLRLGFVLMVLPGGLVRSLVGLVNDGPTLTLGALAFVDALTVFVTVSVAAVYLSRSYLAARTKIDMALASRG